MDQQFSTSKVTVEYFDPHDVYKLLAPGLVPRLPLQNLHWQSHAGPLRSIDTLHVELIQGGVDSAPTAPALKLRRSASTISDGFQTQNTSGRIGSNDQDDAQQPSSKVIGSHRRHQIPGLRRTPYLKVLLVRCDDNDVYKSSVRSEVREWIKTHATPASSSKKSNNQENHDAFEWLIIHVVIPNSVASTQPRTSAKADGTSDNKASSRWRTASTPLLEKLRSDFGGTGKHAMDRITQIRIGINDLPYDLLPRVVPAVPTGYSENEHDAENAWQELIGRFKSLILTSFDMRVTQYEEDIKEKDGQRTLPGWNFCTFFILKEGLARGFESVGLVEDALVGYDELSVGLDSIIQEQAVEGSPESHGGALLSYTEELKQAAEKAYAEVAGNDEEAVDLQSTETAKHLFDDIPISSTKKAYRDKILANQVSVFDFRCYIFSRQISLLLRLGNAYSTREELLAKLKDQQESVLHGVAPLAPPPKHTEESENLSMLGEICRRTLQFIPSVSQIMRRDVISSMLRDGEDGEQITAEDPILVEIVDNLVASFAFSVAQQILAQTSSKSLPIPPSTLIPPEAQEQKASIPEPKTMLHPARTSSLGVRDNTRPPPSPGLFPGPGMQQNPAETETQKASFLKTGLEDLAARRAELYTLSRSILDGLGKKRGWSDGWDEAPSIGDPEVEFQDVDLDEPSSPAQIADKEVSDIAPSAAGLDSHLLQTATDSQENFYRLYEILTDKALRHFTVANYTHAVQASTADLAVLKYYLKDYASAASYFYRTTPFYGESGWSLIELSMLVMYLNCLRELQSKEDYVRVALKLLTKSCAAEKERLEQKSAVRLRNPKTEAPDISSMKGVVGNLFDLATGVSSQIRIPLENFFTDVELAGPPEYYDNEDKCSLTINLRSLLPDEIKLDGVAMRIISTDGGPSKELKFTRKEIELEPGKNSMKVDCTSIIPGKYRIDHLALISSSLYINYESDINQSPSRTADILKNPEVVLIQRAGALDVQLTATKHTALDKNNSLDLVLSPGWNKLKTCEVRVKPATGGLRLLTMETKIVDSSIDFAKPPESGVFYFGSVPAETPITLRFPYSVEQDMGDVAAKLEVTYTTESGDSYFFAKNMIIPISLALGVNVQDVFKHQALFSRFSVTTASSSPLRLYKSELLSSELFDSEFGVSSTNTMMVFPKQAATLLYKIKRKPEGKLGRRSAATMYLKLYYSLLQVEVEDLIRASIKDALEESPLKQYQRAIAAVVIQEMKHGLQPQDLERCALLGEITTVFLADVAWERHFVGVGRLEGSEEDARVSIAAFIRDWQQANPRVPILAASVTEPSTILIPVEIPSLSIVHTADVRLQSPLPSIVEHKPGDTPTACINQMIPATLHLKWTRQWDTETTKKVDQEYSYEVTAPSDTWLLGGRRKGHFVIPGAELSSSAETEAEIPLILIPLREGWLPYPNIEIREIQSEGGAAETIQASEVDWRNLGETVRVVSERKDVTISLDASGSGGGPLVLESEGLERQKGRIVA